MLSTAHMLTGMVIGSTGSEWWEVGFWSILMHFVLDTIPHLDPTYDGSKRWYLIASGDFLFGIILVSFVAGNQIENTMMWLGVFMSILPDVLTMAIKMMDLKLLSVFVSWHKMIQNESKNLTGLLSQIVLLIILIGVFWSRNN